MGLSSRANTHGLELHLGVAGGERDVRRIGGSWDGCLGVGSGEAGRQEWVREAALFPHYHCLTSLCGYLVIVLLSSAVGNAGAEGVVERGGGSSLRRL